MKLNPLLIGLGLAAGLVTGASAQTVLKIGYATTQTSHYGVGSTVFCDDIEKGTQGRYKCQQFPNSALGGEREMIEAVQLGTLDFVNTSTGPVGNFVPEVKIVDIPFLFRDYDHARKVMDGPIGQDILTKFPAKGLVALAWTENGFRHIVNPHGGYACACACQHRRNRSAQPVLGGLACGIEVGNEALATGPQQDGKAQGHQAIKVGQQGQVVGEGLAKPKARVQPDFFALHPGLDGDAGTVCEIIDHLAHDIVIGGGRLHGAGLALHVHQDHLTAQLCGQLGRAGGTQGGDVIPQAGPGQDRRLGHFGFHGVDGHRNARAAA